MQSESPPEEYLSPAQTPGLLWYLKRTGAFVERAEGTTLCEVWDDLRATGLCWDPDVQDIDGVKVLASSPFPF